MATIVQHRQTGHLYILIGTGLGAYRATKPHWFLGDMGQEEDSGTLSLVAVCDASGQIGWFDTRELLVLSVDGESPAALVGG